MKMMTLPLMLLLLPLLLMRAPQVTFDFTMLGGVPVRTPKHQNQFYMLMRPVLRDNVTLYGQVPLHEPVSRYG